jgi:hypothetical protein
MIPAPGLARTSAGMRKLLVLTLMFTGTVSGPWTMARAQTKTATTTTMAVTSNGNLVTTVSSGRVVVLTASVLSGTTAVTIGQVNFCDASAQYCKDIHLLGTAQLTSKGVAVLKLRPGIGKHSYKAVFSGTTNFAASSSSSSSLSATGIHSTTTTIGASGSSGNYTLTATVTGIIDVLNVPAPTGMISFVDMTTNNTNLGTAMLGSYNSGLSFLNSSSPSASQENNVVAAADFNGDGILDLAVSNAYAGAGALTILLGKGDGTFTATVGETVGSYPDSIAVGDFNSDGIPDLAVTSVDQNNVTILLGNGNGTFSSNAPNLNIVGGTPQSVAVGDFNGDGAPDLAVVAGNSVLIFLGNGDGTFNPTAESPSTGSSPVNVAVADFNSDGKDDLAVTNSLSYTVTILLGNGDGTFQQVAVSPAIGVSPLGIAIADFNGDGIADMAVTNYSGEIDGQAVMVLLGKGDGTFGTTTAYSAPGMDFKAVVVADFNGDGVADLAVGEYWQGLLTVLLGRGDGTFGAALTLDAQSVLGSGFVAAADFNGDGVPDLAVPNQGGTVPILLTQPTLSVTANISGISIAGASPQQVYAKYPGDSSYASSQSSTVSLLAPAAPPVFTPAPGTVGLSQSITLASSTPGASIFYQASGVIQTNGYVNYFGPIVLPNVGNLTIQAYTLANNYGQSATSSASYTVVVGNPTPVFLTMLPAFSTAGGPAFSLTINGSGFTSGSAVYWGSTALTTTYVSGTQLTAQVTAAEIAAAGITPITVQTPLPGGGVSDALQFEVDSGGPGTSPSFTTTTATVTAGLTADYPVTLPSFATNVTASCLNLPSAATCSYSVSAGTLTIATASSTPSGTYQITAVFHETLPGSVWALVVGAFLLLPLAAFRKKRRKNHVRALAFLTLALVLSVLTLSNCGGRSDSSGTTTQTHQATSSAVLTLTVQ